MVWHQLDRIRELVLAGDYDLTRHAVDEMAEDALTVSDVEHAILTGEVTKAQPNDPRGPKYIIVGIGTDQRTEVGVVGRLTETGIFLIITVYEVSEQEEY
ncbi:MAG TPA: DUF4258 domain-containing protein [Ardenticatenaceae bacterium]|nr:DUF4258 domain-containing protein [Ardenticatenaceae bacterium]